MSSTRLPSRSIGRLCAAFFILAAAGCQSNDTAGLFGIGGNSDTGKTKVTADELRAYCPAVQLREGTSAYRTYAKGGQDDATKLVYQASISDVTRSCTYAGEMMTINIAVAGRIVPGPAGGAGSLTMPIRIAVVRGEEVLYTQLHQFPVQVNAGTATQFLFNDPNVTIPQVGGGLAVFAGFDEGTPKPKKVSSADN